MFYNKREKMTSRERLLAVLKHKKPDRIPWSPCLDGYFTASLPKDLKMNIVETFRYISADIMERHVPTFKVIPGFGDTSVVGLGSKIGLTEKRKGGEIIRIYETPGGFLRERRKSTSLLPCVLFPIEYKLKTIEDVKIYKYLLENQKYEPYFENFRKEMEYIGQDGLATASGPETPLQALLETEMGIQNFYYNLSDHKNEIEDLLSLMHEKNKEAYRIIAESPAEIVFIYEDTSATSISPDIYKRYEMSQIDDYADIMHRSGKIFITHMCGKLKALAHLIGEGRQDGISELTPPSTGDLDVAQARKIWKNKIIIGGLDPNVLTNFSIKEIENHVKRLLLEISSGDNFILGSGDAVPYGTPIENLRAIGRTVKNRGNSL